MNPLDYQQEFDKIIARKYFDKTLEKTRKEAFSKFLNLGLPTKKWEDWRHTDLSLIKKQNFRNYNWIFTTFITPCSLFLLATFSCSASSIY